MLTYGLVVLELGFETCYPLATGFAIDGLLNGAPDALIPLVAVWLSHAAVGVARQVYDTRLFARLYADVVTDMIDQHDRGGASTSAVAGRVALARELVEFFEDDVPAALTAVLGCLGALVLLATYEPAAGVTALLLVVPVALLNWRYGRRSAAINAKLNDAAEREVDVIATRHRPTIATHFATVARLRIRLSDTEAQTWGGAELFMVAATAAVLVQLAYSAPASVGVVYASLAYLFALIEGLDTTPTTIERSVQAYDITRRFRSPTFDPDCPAS